MTKYLEVAKKLQQTPSTFLVTGGAGFIGSHLAHRLLDLNQEVTVIDNLSTGKQENVDFLEEKARENKNCKFTFIKGDIQDLDICKKGVSGAQYILHQAALGSVPRSIIDPLSTHHSNVTGFLNILYAASESSALSSFVYASSSSVYGDSEKLPKVEGEIGLTLSPYAASKRNDEVYADSFSPRISFPLFGLRYFNVFGARQDPNGPYAAVIPKWINCLKEGKNLTIYGDGETSRDFCYIENVIQANILAATSGVSSGSYKLNIAAGKKTTLNQLAEEIKSVYSALVQHGKESGKGNEKEIEIVYEDFRDGDVRHSLADLTLVKELISYIPQVDVSEGIKYTVKSFI